jgi:uncharacterized protein DUF2721
MPLADNPFTAVTAVVAPAVLTNACSVLCLGTSNRLARAVDRTRVVAAEISSLKPGSRIYQQQILQLKSLERRIQLLLKSLKFLYASLGSFAASALITILGAAIKYFDWQIASGIAAMIAVATGTFAVTGLVIACTCMVRETRLAVQYLGEEAELALSQRTEQG